jgi:hypothetical protein
MARANREGGGGRGPCAHATSWPVRRAQWELYSLVATKQLRGARTRRFITAFTTARHRSLSWPRWIHSTPSQPVSVRSILIPSSDLRLGLPNGLFPSGFHPSNACHMPRPPHSPWSDLPIDIWGWVQIMKLPTVQLPPFSRYFIPLMPKYSPQHPVRFSFSSSNSNAALSLGVCPALSINSVFSF